MKVSLHISTNRIHERKVYCAMLEPYKQTDPYKSAIFITNYYSHRRSAVCAGQKYAKKLGWTIHKGQG